VTCLSAFSSLSAPANVRGLPSGRNASVTWLDTLCIPCAVASVSGVFSGGSVRRRKQAA
jgi:hypothetical protein